MKLYNHLYEKLYSIENLQLAFKKARKGKGSKWYVLEFEADLVKNLLQLQKELSSLTYEPRSLKTFVIRDPKTRVISASNFRDRIVHHALCNIIAPIFEKTFIHDSYANRKKKGAHAAMRRFDYFKRKVSQNGRPLPFAKDSNMTYGYVLKADIKHYFDSIDHDILVKIIERKIRDEKVIWLVRKILANHSCKIEGRGMPIGNLTSQFFANLYLNELDYFVKHELKAKYYIRYVDDFVLLYRSKERLMDFKGAISQFLNCKLELELHPEKSKIYPLHKGVNLLGFRTFYHYKLPKKSNVRKMKRKMTRLTLLYMKGEMSKDKIEESFSGWLAYAEHGNTYKMRRKLRKMFNEALKVN